ncbi:MAG: hypothetical protein ACOX5J_08545 [Candidatus Hydrogenedentales bacterium]|jgi:hypothetical protein
MLCDEPCQGVDVDGRGLAAQPHRLERDGASPGERVEPLRRMSAVGLFDLLAKPVHSRVRFATPVEDAARHAANRRRAGQM